MPGSAPLTLPPTAAGPPAPLPRGPVAVLFNAGSGSTDKAAARAAIEQVLHAAGREFEILPLCAAAAADALCRRLAREDGLLVAAGGDGTVSCAAQSAHRHGLPLAVIPLGTFNYFARQHGIPDDPAAAARLLLEGELRAVDAGAVNGLLFLNNASIGLYTRLIQERERAKARFGRWRIVAALSAAAALLRGQRPFAIRIVDGEAAALQHTSMLFVACNGFPLEALGLKAAACTRAGVLGVLLLKPTRLWQRLRLLLRTALRDLDEDQRLLSFCAADFTVQSQRRRIELVADGEIVGMQTPLDFRVLPAALRLVVPRAGTE